ncbi:hypothetical protein ACFE04_001477 [Oxalis oulophora]
MTSLSFSKTILSSSSSSSLIFLTTNFSNLTLHPRNNKHSSSSSFIRMGGGPRTFPGGVSKWQWKRMQAKKSKQLLKARLCRERQIYEMRKRAELKAAVTELERPWEPVQAAPNLFSATADEQMKVLADRFQKPGGFDLWSDRDGPTLFQTPHNDFPLPTARFFPKGVVHSVKPYRRVLDSDDDDDDDDNDNDDDEVDSVVVKSSSLGKENDRMSGRKSWRKRKERPSFNNRKKEDMRGEVYDGSSQTKWGYRFQDKNDGRGFESEYEVKMAEFQDI